MDLLGRKLSMNGGKAFQYFIDRMKQTVEQFKDTPGLQDLCEKVSHAVSRLEALAREIGARSRSDRLLNAYAFAHPFLEVTGDVTFAWMLLWRAGVAAPKLAEKTGTLDRKAVAEKAEKNKEAAFYAGQLETARFFIHTLLPATYGKMDAILEGDPCVEHIQDLSFGSR
jgi:hypothetical protein